MRFDLEIFLIVSFILLLLGLALFVWWWRQQRAPPPVSLTPPPELVLQPVFLRFTESIPIAWNDPQLQAQPVAWQERMRAAGRVFQQAGVRHIFFLHGTFVGSDPLDLLPPLRSVLPQMYERVEPRLQAAMRGLVNRVAGDNGNFLPAYISLFEKALGHKAHCHLLEWSSANHHIGRLMGAVRLLEFLLAAKNLSGHERILLIGHSHARQVFGLLTHLLGLSPCGLSLWAFLREHELVSSQFEEACRPLSQLGFDFVTLGGPVRYAWAFLPGMRALHLINHRGDQLLAEKPLGFWQTAAGDYVQQWGTIGSDTLATTGRERQLNRWLDPILGKGTDTRLWFDAVVRRERLGNFGRTLLIDYGDQSRGRPNFLSTVFGHGIYTRYRCMLFQTELICRYLYDQDISSE